MVVVHGIVKTINSYFNFKTVIRGTIVMLVYLNGWFVRSVVEYRLITGNYSIAVPAWKQDYSVASYHPGAPSL